MTRPKWQVSILFWGLYHITLTSLVPIPAHNICLHNIHSIHAQIPSVFSMGQEGLLCGKTEAGLAIRILKLMPWTWHIIQHWSSSLKPSENVWTDSAGNPLSGLLISSDVLSIKCTSSMKNFLSTWHKSLVIYVLRSSMSITHLRAPFHITFLQESLSYLP